MRHHVRRQDDLWGRCSYAPKRCWQSPRGCGKRRRQTTKIPHAPEFLPANPPICEVMGRSGVVPPESSVRAVRSHTRRAVDRPQYEERNADVGNPHPARRPRLAASSPRIENVGRSNGPPCPGSAAEWRVRGGAGPGSGGPDRVPPGRADLRPRDHPLRARRGSGGDAGMSGRSIKLIAPEHLKEKDQSVEV